MRAAWIYIMTNRPSGTLYVGVASDIRRRMSEHKERLVDGFTRQYGLHRLVYAEQHGDMVSAIQREKNIKHWPRAWTVRLIGRDNPEWNDLADALPY
jgi:putative endonuclease